MKFELVCCAAGASILTAVAAWSAPESGRGSSAVDPTTRHRAAIEAIEAQVFSVLRPEDQARVLASGAYTPALSGSAARQTQIGPATDAEYALVRDIVSRETFDSMPPGTRRLLGKMARAAAEGRPVPDACFAPGTDPAIVRAFELAHRSKFGPRFQPVGRWVQTATNAGPMGQGDQCTITYSFVPDGTVVDTSDGSTSNLFARLNTIYPGGPAVWQALYDQIFQRWSQLCGVKYVRETHDDGVAFGGAGSFGALGVRGDVRLSGSPIDGDGNVLAFNYYPDQFDGIGGDMVIDTNDNFYTDTASNSLKLRNVLAHEHGHGLGFAHECPTLTTRLMEPFVATNFDGPQLDDILNAQRFYGDQNEPNDTIGTANIILGAGAAPQTLMPLSIDAAGDVDDYRFPAVPANSLLTVTVTPLGFRYANDPQAGDGSCNASGAALDPSITRALSLKIRLAVGSTVATATGAPGATLTIPFAVGPAGDYIAEVAGADAIDDIQGYQLTYSVAPASPPLGLYLPMTLPAQVLTGAATPVQVGVSATANAPAKLFFRYSTGGAFTQINMVSVGGVWQASLPAAPCLGTPQFYFSATSGVTTATLPAGAPASVFTALVQRSRVTIFSDSFESDLGWAYGQPGDTATTGQWQRGKPNGTTAQPDNANTGTNCAATGLGNPGEAAGVNDVDNGFTTLLSPSFSLATTRDARIGYARWYTNTAGAAPGADTFRVDISNNNGAAWTPLEVVGPGSPGNQGGWVVVSLPLPAGLAPTTQMRLRFIAEDAAPGSLIEAAIDDVTITASPTADFNGSGTITVQDIFDLLTAYFAGNLAADFNKSGTVSVQDFFDFLASYFNGC